MAEHRIDGPGDDFATGRDDFLADVPGLPDGEEVGRIGGERFCHHLSPPLLSVVPCPACVSDTQVRPRASATRFASSFVNTRRFPMRSFGSSSFRVMSKYAMRCFGTSR